MSVIQIVNRALESGYLTSAMEADISQRCDRPADMGIDDYMALDRLMDALMKGQVTTLPRKQFVNVMEELVIAEATARIVQLESSGLTFLDLGDVAAYALNRLPALYATTEEGADYQRDRASEMLRLEITATVNEAIALSMAWPDFPNRQALQPQEQQSPIEQPSTQIAAWLKTLIGRGEATIGTP